MVKAIPKKLLIHNADYLSQTNKDRWGNFEYETTTLSNILVQSVSGVSFRQQNESRTYRAILFFCCQNSIPSNFEFKVNDKIIFDNVEYKISGIEVLNAFKKHHIEVILE